jgi:hypothetical protein
MIHMYMAQIEDTANVQSLYKVASEVLYHSPIVQNMGLFLVGIDKPYPRPSSVDTTKCAGFAHKRYLLAQVRKIHIIHSSTNRPLESVYMQSASTGNPKESLSCNADQLGQMDLQGWILASSLINGEKQAGRGFTHEDRSYFHRLETIAYGRWDDGRWDIYDSQVHDGHWIP